MFPSSRNARQRFASFRFITIVLVYLLLSANLNAEPVRCTADFFADLRAKVTLHLCQADLRPNCVPPTVSRAGNGLLTVALSSAGGGLAKAGLESFQAYGREQVALNEIFAQKLRSGEYFSDKLYGREIFPRAEPNSTTLKLTTEGVAKALLFRAVLFAGFYLTYSNSPERCSSTMIGHMITQKIIDGVCRPDIAYSENVIRFLTDPISDQERSNKSNSFPEVCAFYQSLSQRVMEDLQPQAKLTDYTCEGGKPKSLKVSLDGHDANIVVNKQSLGKITGLQANFAENNETYKINFLNCCEVGPLETPVGNVSLATLIKAGRPVEHYLKRTRDVMKSWWAASPIVSTCCANPGLTACKAGSLRQVIEQNEPKSSR